MLRTKITKHSKLSRLDSSGARKYHSRILYEGFESNDQTFVRTCEALDPISDVHTH